MSAERSKTTPVMAQYRRAKAELAPGTLLFFRLGDFYEMFLDDAIAGSEILGLTLTKRNGMPMCGVPYHAAELYLSKLLRAGKKVAICDQMEDAGAAKGLIKREITSIVTPGTVLSDSMLDASRPNYIAGLHKVGKRYGLAMLELSTGEFWMEETESAEAACDDLALQGAAEAVVSESLAADAGFLELLHSRAGDPPLAVRDEWTFEPATADDGLCRHFGVASLDGYGAAGHPAASAAAGALLYYVVNELRRNAAHVRSIRFRASGEAMILDEATLANLDIVETRGGTRNDVPTTLLGALDACKTAMGSRLLRDWLLRPLRDKAAIEERHEAVAAFLADRAGTEKWRALLGRVKDVERLVARLAAGGGNARDLRALAASLRPFPELRERLEGLSAGAPDGLAARLARRIAPQEDLADLLERSLVDEPPATTREGGMIRPGCNPDLDALRDAASGGKNWLAELQAREIGRTGIKSLKIRFNKVFGYFIEVTKSNLSQVPSDYVRKQTTVNGERFVTPELKEVEDRIRGAEERSVALEAELFRELRDEANRRGAAIQDAARALAELDVLAAFAARAADGRYVRPRMLEEGELTIREGRHPVVERLPESGRFVPNDTHLDTGDTRLIVLTGPNMAGKSTYIKQVALIVVMAQAGSFVPAAEARIAIADRVFTRVGAGDDIARGRSTFMVEMQETANILNNATERSLVVLDEIGRGTSTYDGISIAWSVAEYLHDNVRAKTLFATHYHELTDIALTLPGVKNYNVMVKESGDKIVFLRRIAPGAADKSYGIQVAHLAGLPPPVVARAKEILANLEEAELSEAGKPKLAQPNPRVRRPNPAEAVRQLSLFDWDGDGA